MLYRNFEVETIISLEINLKKEIKGFIEKAIRTNKIDKIYLANSMGLGEVSFDAFMEKQRWSLNTCLWIANEVKYPINLTVGRKLVNITSPGFTYRDLEEK